MLRVFVASARAFTVERARDPMSVVLLVVLPALFVTIFAGVLPEFSSALGGDVASQSTTALSAGWAAALLSGTLAFFHVAAGRVGDRRLALAGNCGPEVALARIGAAIAMGLVISLASWAALWATAGTPHPWHALAALMLFSATYIGIGALAGAAVRGLLEGSLLVVLLFLLDAFTSPVMTSSAPLNWSPTRSASEVLLDAGGGMPASSAEWLEAGGIAAAGLGAALLVFSWATRVRR